MQYKGTVIETYYDEKIDFALGNTVYVPELKGVFKVNDIQNETQIFEKSITLTNKNDLSTADVLLSKVGNISISYVIDGETYMADLNKFDWQYVIDNNLFGKEVEFEFEQYGFLLIAHIVKN
jgi:hypothetical protein